MKTMQEILEVFIDRMDDVLNQKGLNKTQLAKELGIPSKTFISWMAGTRAPKIDYLWLIADYLDVTIDYLVGREN